MTSTSDLVQRTFEKQMTRWRAGEARKPTIVSIAADSGISRSALYRSHPGVVARIQGLNGDQGASRRDQLCTKVALLTAQLKAEKELTRALALACAELAAEKADINEQLNDEKLSFQLRVEHLEKRLRGGRNVRLLHSKR